jgi:hypothetical protein
LSGIDGTGKVLEDSPFVQSGNIVEYIRCVGARAWIGEYGGGSEADLLNPYLDEYVNNPNFNHYRSKSDMTVRGRDAGEYLDLNGEAHESTGRAAGKDLELKPVYQGMSMPPMHIIEENIQASLPDLYARLSVVIPQLIAQQLAIDFTVTI